MVHSEYLAQELMQETMRRLTFRWTACEITFNIVRLRFFEQ
jgi:hypothetical protein